MKTPIAFFIFNRPEETARVFASIARAQPEILYVIADGPRAEVAEDTENCRAARKVVDQIDWPCELHADFSTTNLGCKYRVASGLDWVFSRSENAIILEDDTLPDPSFFPYCEELLQRYRNEPRVQMITGSNYLLGRRVTDDSYYFSRFYHVWGWASWARAWACFDVEMQQWPELRDSGWVEETLPNKAMAAQARYYLEETYAGRIDTWDFQWSMCGALQGGLVAVPSVNLVTNLGYGEQATHTSNTDDILAKLDMSAMQFPIRHPRRIEILEEADLLEWELLAGQTPAEPENRNPLARLFRRK